MATIKQLSKMTACAAFLSLGAIFTTPSANAASIYLQTSSYQSLNDSPFQGSTYSYFYLEDFEDNFLNTPGVTASGGRVLPPRPTNTLTDSVDNDDGLINGSGSDGYSWYSEGNSTLRFAFDASVLGNLPTNVGIVWTDVGFSSHSFGFGKVNFEAFDALNASLGIFDPTPVGDGSVNGQTAEDRFFGVFNTGGISAIEISMLDSTDWEVDHLQYGWVNPKSVPEPMTMWSLLTAGAMGLCLRSQRRRKLASKIKNRI
ncbi:PEP-CTERM sorting domain-containing protein [Halotia wernerae UHCC 0503]|nr:PEP-CTERM sorting domain-containing protein [Halotia wernerae UHCC 0503]